MFLLLLLLHRLMFIISPLPPKENWQNCRFVSLKTFVKTAQNQFLSFFAQKISTKWTFFFVFWWNLSQIFQQNSCEISHFFYEFVSKNPTKFDFFSVTYQKPCVMNSLCYKSSWSVRLFLSLSPTFFPPQMSIMSSLDQSYFKKVKVWITLYIRSIKERTKRRAI